MTNSDKFTNEEWEKLASMLSGEETGDPDLRNRFMKDDLHNTADIWKDMGSSTNIDVEKAWQNVSSKISQAETVSAGSRVLTLRETLFRIAAAVLILISIGKGAFYL